jgi:hypothetical protein
MVNGDQTQEPKRGSSALGLDLFQLVSIIAGDWTRPPPATKNPRNGAGRSHTVGRVARLTRLRGGLPLGTFICGFPKSSAGHAPNPFDCDADGSG